MMLRNSLLLLTSLLALPAFPAAAQSKPDAVGAASSQAPAIPARITQAIDETQLVRLRGNVHPLARPEFDQGVVGDAAPMKRMMLVLQRSPEQQAALTKFMDEQLSKDSPNFHNWLTPEQFGKQFGPADADIQTVTDWLAHQGFQQIKVGAGRTAIEFSGNVAQVRNAFHTEIHQINVNGESRQANLSILWEPSRELRTAESFPSSPRVVATTSSVPPTSPKFTIFLPRSMEQGSISLSSLIQTLTPKT
jgi:hypothetical protein